MQFWVNYEAKLSQIPEMSSLQWDKYIVVEIRTFWHAVGSLWTCLIHQRCSYANPLAGVWVRAVTRRWDGQRFSVLRKSSDVCRPTHHSALGPWSSLPASPQGIRRCRSWNWVEIAISRMSKYNLSPSVLRWFSSYLSGWWQVTEINGVKNLI